ncbi:Hypothetical Protein FCC1311_107972 [Hondaea fermentalgiana]|uniref:PX domain-containing protein n=1 Tax=Hondaea fermentalgiana TaxID=2315210 RepID=A0A2R5GUM7_9STRA|nr:Hypothetical Protein FCC1311_107972 [Hondaea fermentalgiana]|eukprot:GBG34576.1 Hypothetical Protein FCC1311_107972 [Hondaea fermentalgiana]
MGFLRFASFVVLALALGVFLGPKNARPNMHIVPKLDNVRAKLEATINVLPHLPALLPYATTLLPYSLELLNDIDRLGPMVESIMAEKQYLMPLLPRLLVHRALLLEYMDVLEPHVHKLAPHSEALLDHMDQLVPHLDAMRPHVGNLICFLEVRGWEDSLTYIDQILPHIAILAPHTKRLCLYYDTLLPHLPMLAKYIEYMDVKATLDVLDRLIPLISFLPLADQSGMLYSRLVCKSIPTVARILPPQGPPVVSTDLAFDAAATASPSSHHPKSKVLVRRHFERSANAVCGVMSPLPGRIRAHTMSLHVPDAYTDASGVVRYHVVLDFAHAQSMRYRELRAWHKLIESQISNYCGMRLLPFPQKTFCGRKLSTRGISRRRFALEDYFDRLAENSHILIEESPAFRAFVRTFFANGDETDSTLQDLVPAVR